MTKYILHDTVTLRKSSAPLPDLLKERLIDILCHILFPSKHTKLIPITSNLYLETSLQVLLCAGLPYIKANSPLSKRKHGSLYLRRVVHALFIVTIYTRILVSFIHRGKYQYSGTDQPLSTRLQLPQSTSTMLQFCINKT